MDNCITEGKAVPPEMIRPFTESSDLLGNTAALTARLKEDGYLFFRGALAASQASVGTKGENPWPRASRVAQSLNDLAELYESQGKHPEAEPLFKRARDILRNVLGPSIPALRQP